MTSHMKSEHRFGAVFSKRPIGDGFNIILSTAWQTMRKLLNLLGKGKIFSSFLAIWRVYGISSCWEQTFSFPVIQNDAKKRGGATV